MFLAIDRVSKFTYVEFHDSAGKMEGSAFLRNVVEAFPYQIHTVLTDNGMAFADLPKNRDGRGRRFLGPHIFDRVCIANGIEHRLTKPYHPWTTDEVEQPFMRRSCYSVGSTGDRVTKSRAEVEARPRRPHSRSSFAASVGARRPRRVHPSVIRR
jgi:transposase InsO family protein